MDERNIIREFKKKFSLTNEEVKNFVRNAPNMYKIHYIQKRNGGKREIAQPVKSLKIVQRWIIKQFLFEQLPIHKVATAYVYGKSILDFANPHKTNQYLLKIDFQNFFNSIHVNDFYELLLQRDFYSNQDNKETLGNLLFCRNKFNGDLYLSIGAPSSPYISNLIMHEFDNQVYEYCLKEGIIYTRYADDLAFSTNHPNILKNKLIPFLHEICNRLDYPKRLQINSNKTVFTSKKHNRTLTGLVISNNGTISIGREKKRKLRAMAHQASLNLLTLQDINQLKGKISFLKSIDPDFAKQLEEISCPNSPK